MNMKFLSMKLKTIFHTIHRQKNKNKQMRPHETSVQNLLYSFCKKLLGWQENNATSDYSYDPWSQWKWGQFIAAHRNILRIIVPRDTQITLQTERFLDIFSCLNSALDLKEMEFDCSDAWSLKVLATPFKKTISTYLIKGRKLVSLSLSSHIHINYVCLIIF